MSTSITVVGNLTADPQVVQTKAGNSMTTFTIAETSRRQSADGNWEDGNTTFYRCRCFPPRARAEGGLQANAAKSLKKGMRVIATGDLEVVTREGTTRDGETAMFTDASLLVRDLGPSLVFAFVDGTITKSNGGTYVDDASGSQAYRANDAEEAPKADDKSYLDAEEAPAEVPAS